MRFAPPPAQEAHALPVTNATFTIPPGEPNHQVRTRVSFPRTVTLLAVTPHAHRRARRFEYRVVSEDGRGETILVVPRYNWLWQTSYAFAEPIALPPGTAVEIVATYDNSSANKANPDPKREVTVGWDPAANEMMFSDVVFAVPRLE